MTDTVRIIVDIVLLLTGAGGIVSWLKARAERQKLGAESKKLDAESEKTEAETDSVKLDTLMRLVDKLDERLRATEQENAAFRQEICSLRTEIDALRRQIAEQTEKDQQKDSHITILLARVKALITVSKKLVNQMARLEISPEVKLPAWVREYDEENEDDSTWY